MNYKLGYRREPPDYRDLAMIAPPPKYDLPKEVDWTEQLTEVRDQGNEGSCVGFATTGLKEFQEWREYGKKYDFSERWIYEWAKEEDEFPGIDYEGTTIRGAMKALQKHGICPEELWPYVPGEKGEPDEQAASRAFIFKIKKYRSLITPEKNVKLIKRGLHETGPVVVGIAVHSTWFDVEKDGIIKPSSSQDILGYHAILAVAYDEKFLKFKNSWGTGWGAQGYGFLEWEFAMFILHSAWAAYDL